MSEYVTINVNTRTRAIIKAVAAMRGIEIKELVERMAERELADAKRDKLIPQNVSFDELPAPEDATPIPIMTVEATK